MDMKKDINWLQLDVFLITLILAWPLDKLTVKTNDFAENLNVVVINPDRF